MSLMFPAGAARTWSSRWGRGVGGLRDYHLPAWEGEPWAWCAGMQGSAHPWTPSLWLGVGGVHKSPSQESQ